jgi:hypothetical protein
MKITVEGAKHTPSWETLEKALNEMLVHPDRNEGEGRLIRIARLDEHGNYRAPGIYELNFEYIRFATRVVELVVLEVK